MKIVTAADRNYVGYLTSHLTSLGKHGSKKCTLEITVIHRGISQECQARLKARIPPPHRVTWVEPTFELLRKVEAPLDFVSCSPHYFRLLIPYLFKEASRVLYLDADTLVLEDLWPLWNLDLEKHTIGAAPDYLSFIEDGVANWQELHLDPQAPYFNSGVLLINLSRWREQNISLQVLELCRKYPHHLIAQGKWPQHDQYGLNVSLYQKWKPLDRSWNYGTDLPFSKAHILHFVGNGKVGKSQCQSKCHPLFAKIFSSFQR
jgi:lipopolysaccharide biosynthesis glycosyltransferase